MNVECIVICNNALTPIYIIFMLSKSYKSIS